MTKKSDARLERDKRAKEFETRLKNEGIDKDTCWGHLNGCYDNAKALFVEYFKLAAMVRDDKTTVYFTAEEGTRATNLMKALAVDCEPLQQETEKLRSKHAGRKGVPVTEEDNYLIISLQQDYGVLLNNHGLTILPVLQELDELLVKALGRRGRAERAAAEAAQAAQAPAEQVAGDEAPAAAEPASTPSAATYEMAASN